MVDVVDVSYLVNSFLREGPPKVSMICSFELVC